MPKTVFIEAIGANVDYPDEWSDDQIAEHATKTFNPAKEDGGVVGSVARAARNFAGTVVESAAAIPQTVAVIAGKLATEFPSLGETRPREDLPTQRMADWLRYQAERIYPDPGQRPEGVQGFITDTLPSMFGSTASAFAGGAGLKVAAGLPAFVSAAAVGAAINGASAFREAVTGGANDETSFRVFLANAGVGLTEAVPIAKWLNADPVISSKLKRALIDGSEELAQEVFQQISQNAIASHYFDPERPWLQGAGEAGAGGFTVGTLFSLAVSAMSGGKKVSVARAAQQARESQAPQTATVLDLIKEEAPPQPPAPAPVVEQPAPEPAPVPAAAAVPDAEKPITAPEAAVVAANEDVKAAEAPVTPDPETGIMFEGRPATASERPTVRLAAKAVQEVNSELGNPIARIVVQDLDPGASGIASAPRAEAFDTIVIDPAKLADSMSNGLTLKEAVHQEIIHNFDGLAVQRRWEAEGKPGTFREFWDKTHQAIAAEMTPAERAETERLYGAKLPSDIHLAAEFIQLLLRGEFRGNVNPAPASTLGKLLGWVREFWKSISNNANAGISSAARSHIADIEKIIANGKAQATTGNSGVEVGPAVSPDGAGKQGSGTGEESKAQSGLPGAGPDAGSSARAGQPGGEAGASLPNEQWQVEAYGSIQRQVESMNGLTDTERDLLFTRVRENVFNRATEFLKAKGSMEGFALKELTSQQAINAIKEIRAKKRSPAGGTISLDQPIDQESGATVGDTVAQSGGQEQGTSGPDATEVAARLVRQLSPTAQEVLNASFGEDRGWMTKMAREKGAKVSTISARLETARKQLARLALQDPQAIELFSADDLYHAAPPVVVGVQYPAPRASDLTMGSKFIRFFRPSTWAAPGYLRAVADRTQNTISAGLLRRLADGIEKYYDRRAELLGVIERDMFAVMKPLGPAEFQTMKDEVETWASTAQARDGQKPLAQSWADAELLIPTLSKPAQAMIGLIKQHGIRSGVIMRRLNVHVKDGGVWRPVIDLAEKYWPRRLANDIQEILADPDANRAKYNQLLDQLVAHDPKTFKTLDDADRFLSESGGSTVSNGDFFSGVEMARGDKLPDAWYDYTLDGYMLNMESWANRVAQIEAFGQSMPGGNIQRPANAPSNWVEPERRDLFDIVTQEATRQAEGDGLKRRVQLFKDEILDSQQSKWADTIGHALSSIATIRYLTASLTMVRNASQSMVATAENLGAIRTLYATTRGLADAAWALGASVKSGRLVEPELVSQAAAAGAVQRALYFSTLTGIVSPATNSRLGRFTQIVMKPNQLVEQLNRSINYMAAQLWLKDAADEWNANPQSRASRKFQAQMQRWGLSRQERIDAMAGNAVAANKFFRAAVKEKQFGYHPDQVPIIFRSRYGKLLLQFQSWGAQRSRDIARNLIGPAIFGETVDGQKVRDIWPMLRFVVGVVAGTALVNGIKSAIFDRRERNTQWQEIMNAASQDEQMMIKLALDRIGHDLTATGAAGILPDYLRIMKDGLTPGRQKDFVNAPGLQLAVDITALIKDQIERGTFDEGALMRDIRDRLLRTTPVVKEIEDASLSLLLSDTDAAKIRSARQDVSVARAKMRAWAKETGHDDQGTRRGAQTLKSASTESYESIQEALLIGDVATAGKLINELTKYRSDGKKLNAIKSSMRSRHPLSSPGMDKAEVDAFMAWLKKRNPSEYARVSATVNRFDATARLVGLK